MLDVNAHYSDLLAARRADARLRTLREIMPGEGAMIYVNRRPLIDFGSNDYLGLSNHPFLKQRAIEYVNRFGVGSTASRLLSGNIAPFEYVERKLAALKGTEAALLLPTGFQANATILPALADAKTQVVCDKFSHQSLLCGAQLSQGKWTRFAHNDMDHLRVRLDALAGPDALAASRGGLQSRPFSRTIIVTESVFSMDGDIADLDALSSVATEYGALLYVDEAHATGVLGLGGMGLTARRSDVQISMGTFGKGLGSFGAYVACSNQMRDYLINFCGGLIYSTALPPAVLGAIDAALDLIPSMEKQRQMVLANAELLRSKLNTLGFDTGKSQTQIVPIIVGKDEHALDLAQYLEDGGFFAPAIRPPTVPDGTARVRLSLTTLHTAEQLERLCTLMRNWRAR